MSRQNTLSTHFTLNCLPFQPLPIGPAAQSNAGSPKSCGWKSSIVLSRSVASVVRLRSRLSSGTIATCMPAASAAFTPLGASSNTKHWAKGRERTKCRFSREPVGGQRALTVVRKCTRSGWTLRLGKWSSRSIDSEEFVCRSVPKLLNASLESSSHEDTAV